MNLSAGMPTHVVEKLTLEGLHYWVFTLSDIKFAYYSGYIFLSLLQTLKISLQCIKGQFSTYDKKLISFLINFSITTKIKLSLKNSHYIAFNVTKLEYDHFF